MQTIHAHLISTARDSLCYCDTQGARLYMITVDEEHVSYPWWQYSQLGRGIINRKERKLRKKNSSVIWSKLKNQ
jgi:hypothetical protein